MIVFNYVSKKDLKENVGEPLRYIETSMLGAEYVPNGQLTGLTVHTLQVGDARRYEWVIAQVTMLDGLIKSVK